MEVVIGLYLFFGFFGFLAMLQWIDNMCSECGSNAGHEEYGTTCLGPSRFRVCDKCGNTFNWESTSRY